jgi:hypothetical protein
MSDQDDFKARLKRVEGRSRYKHLDKTPPKLHSEVRDSEVDTDALILSILRPQLAFILGFVGLIAGRALAMHFLGYEPKTDLLGFGDGAAVVVVLVVLGLLFGLSDHISHGALIVGATLSFVLESYYIPALPDLMSKIYTPGYVALVTLGVQ